MRSIRSALVLSLAFVLVLAGPASVSGQDGESEWIRISVGDMTFDALAAGPADGELVLLLHGFPQAGFAYREQLRALGEAGFRAVAPNQRGYSPDARPEGVSAYGMTSLVGDVLGMASALGYERFHLVGHDWGAAVAWVVAGSVPARVISLVALSTPHVSAFGEALADPDSEQAQASSYFATFRAEGSERRFLANGARQFRDILNQFAMEPEDTDRYLDLLGTEAALGAALNWYRASATATNSSSASQSPMIVQVPTMYVWSTADVAFARETAEASADFVAGPYRFEVMEGVSHWIAEEAPDELNRLLLEHLAEWRTR